MKKFLLFLLLLPVAAWAGNGTTTKFNPYTGKLDFVGPGHGLLQGDTFYFFNSSTYNAYYTFDGINFCLFVNDENKGCQSSPGEFVLLEDGKFLLLEDGGRIILE